MTWDNFLNLVLQAADQLIPYWRQVLLGLVVFTLGARFLSMLSGSRGDN
jgi:hypothetical protein